jgi:hypothetical protein
MFVMGEAPQKEKKQPNGQYRYDVNVSASGVRATAN